MGDQERREAVAANYGRVARKLGGPGTAGPGPGLGASYGGETAGLPMPVVGGSLGCGNPLHDLELRPDAVVLDLGCGGGLDLILAARRLGPEGRAIGIDLTPEMVALARRNLKAAGVANAEVRQGTIEELPVEDAYVDLAVSNCVINLSPEKERAVREIRRVLRPGGRMVIADIFAAELPAELRADPAAWSACVAGAIPEAEFLRLLGEAGLEGGEVTSRHVLSRDELAAMLGAGGGSGCCSGGGCCSRSPVPLEVVADLAGKVTSSVVQARRSGG